MTPPARRLDEGPPKVGVHINGTASTDDDTYIFDAADYGTHVWSVTDYTPETIPKFSATSDGKTGDSAPVIVQPQP